jgi:diacylglycerol kinase family enzyme
VKLRLLLNRDSGTLRGLDPEQAARELADIFRAHRHDVTVEIQSGRHAVAAIARICKAKDCDGLIVGGGDGTISAAAVAAAESRLTLGVLPLGTMNLFARSLGVPLEMRAAAEALAGGRTTEVDLGEVNGRLFVHHVTLGLHPRMIGIRGRLRYGSRLGKILATIQAWWMALKRPPLLDAAIRAGEDAFSRRTAAILVSNNPLGEGHLPYPDDLRLGRLGLYVTASRRWADLLELAARMTIGEFTQSPLLEHRDVKSLEISLPRPAVRVSIDGEIVTLATPLRFSVRRRSLTVFQAEAAG